MSGESNFVLIWRALCEGSQRILISVDIDNVISFRPNETIRRAYARSQMCYWKRYIWNVHHRHRATRTQSNLYSEIGDGKLRALKMSHIEFPVGIIKKCRPSYISLIIYLAYIKQPFYKITGLFSHSVLIKVLLIYFIQHTHKI